MSKRTIAAAAGITAAVLTGGAVGATLGVPGVSGAQEDTPSTTTEASTDTGAAAERGPGEGHEGRGRFGIPHFPGFGTGSYLDDAAEVLDMPEDDLRDALADGSTFAEIAEAQGVDRQDLIDALVASGEAALDEAKAALPDRIAEVVDGTYEWPGKGHFPGPGGFPRIGAGVDVAADVLNMTEDELREALADGSSLAEVAEAQGVERQELIDALVSATRAHLEEQVAEGDLTQEQADRRLDGLTEMIERRVDGTGRFGG